MRSCGRGEARRAFTLVEVLVVTATIAVLSSLVLVGYQNVREASREGKLESDVASLNSSVSLYVANGGMLEGVDDVNWVLQKLKSQAVEMNAPGLSGSFVDRRVEPVFQNAEQADGNGLRAFWDSGEMQFVVARQGDGGVHEFRLNEALALEEPMQEERFQTVAYSQNGNWVWDFQDVSPSVTGPTGGTPGGSSVAPLLVPEFSPEGGDFPLHEFDALVTLTNPNPSGSSTLFYTVGGVQLTEYAGEEIRVGPGGRVQALAVSLDPERWVNSSVASHRYEPIPLQLVVEVQLPMQSIDYQTAGGEMINQPTLDPPSASVTITNLGDIPTGLQSSSFFQVYSTTDGTDPLESSTAVPGGSFSDGYVPMEFPLSVGFLSAQEGDSLLIRAVAKSENPKFFLDSQVDSATVTVDKMSLAPPYIDPPSGTRLADMPVGIYPGTGAQYPVGFRIFYTIDGSDPVPGAPGTNLYTGPFTTGTVEASIRARIYGPAGYSNWFTPSAQALANYSSSGGDIVGAFVDSANLNGTFFGSLIISDGKNFNMNSGSAIRQGNLFVIGTPDIVLNGGVIEGREFLADGTEIISDPPDTRKIVDLDGNVNPSNYNVRLNNNSIVEGKVFRRITPFEKPTVDKPPPPSNNNNLSLSSPPASPINPAQFANINLNSGAGDVPLMPGHYGNMNAGSGSSFVLGEPGATEPAVYSFSQLNLNSSSQLKIVGPVILTIDSNVNINNNVIMGNPDHPSWLDLRLFSGNFNINSSAAAYANVTAPNSNVTLSGTFRGGVIAQTLTINGDGVVISTSTIVDPEEEEE